MPIVAPAPRTAGEEPQLSTPKIVYVIGHNKPEQVGGHGAPRTVASACKELALAAFLDIEQARVVAEIRGERQQHPGLTWQESNNPLLGNATGRQATTEVDGRRTVVFRVTAVEVVPGQRRPLSRQPAT
ncbi:hypothetical protein AB0B79_24245 [Streptomyces sp. NPDC039022]|uniref:hypothetical protein n=1 Tax=unclassified Streptomyces TaxID=2593676 RepID=UPI003403AA8B